MARKRGEQRVSERVRVRVKSEERERETERVLEIMEGGQTDRQREKESKGEREREGRVIGDDNGIPRNVISIASVIDQATHAEYGN